MKCPNGLGITADLLLKSAPTPDLYREIAAFGTNFRNCSPLLGQNPVTSPMPAGPVAGKRVGRHGAIEPSR